MSLTPAVLDAMVAAGCTAEQIVAAVKADMVAQVEQRAMKRAKDAERQRKSRSNRAGHKVSRVVTVTECDPPNDIYSNPPLTPSAKADCPPDLAKRVEEHWNDTAKRTGLTAARALDNSRRQALRLRVKEHGEQAAFDAINRLGASEWHTGKNENGWKATIGWFLKPANFLKALEMPDPPDSQPARQWSDAERLEYLKSLETA